MNRALDSLLPRPWRGSIQQLRDHLRTPLYANAYLLILNQGLSALLGVLYWVAAAHFYSADLTGKGSAIISTLGYVSALAELSLKSGMQRFIPRAGRHVRKLVLLGYGVILLASALILLIFLAAGDWLHFSDSLLAGLNPKMLAFFVLATLCYTVFIVQDGVLMGLRQALWVLLENTFFNVAKVVVLFAAVSGIFGNGIAASWFIPAPFVVLVVNLLVFFRFIPHYLRNLPDSVSPLQPRQIIKSVTGDHVGTILSETSFRLLPLMIINLLGTSANAYFYQAWLIGSMLYLVSSNVSSSFTVEAASHPARIAAFSRQTLRHSLFLAVPLMLVVAGAAPFILQIYGSDYARQGAPLLRWLALAAVPYAFNAWFLSYSRVKANIKAIILTQGLQCAITLGLSFWWMPAYGIASVGLAWLSAQLFTAGMAFVMTHKILFSHEPAGEPVAVTGIATRAQEPVLEPGSNQAQPFSRGSEIYIFLSPHLDDAVLSCGGYIARLAAAGEQVVIATFFTSDLPQGKPLSWLARRNLRSWNMAGSLTPFADRRLEDQAAAARLGVQTIHLGLLDAMYRSGADGLFYYTRNTVGVSIHPEDEKRTGQAIQENLLKIMERYSSFSQIRLFAPLGLSQHVDHLLVRNQAQALFGQETLAYYEELPYAARNEFWKLPEISSAEYSPGFWRFSRLNLNPAEIEAWVEATACYTSQITGLFPRKLEQTLEVLYARTPVFLKPVWNFHDRKILQAELTKRVTQSLNHYLRRSGGMNFWLISSSFITKGSEVETIEAQY